MEDILYERMHQPFRARFSKLEKENNPTRKAELFYKLWIDLFDGYALAISKLTKSEYEKLIAERSHNLLTLSEEIKKMGLEYATSQGNISLDDLMIMGFQPYSTKEQSSGKLDEILSKKDTMERMLSLEILRRFQLQSLLYKANITLEPLSQLNKLVKRRFGNDENWSLAVAILATHENLVKKKLIDLGISEDEINKTEKEKKFVGLLDLLNKKILEVEKRQVSLTFYKSSSLREVRNTLEHYGYSQAVTKSDVLELLKDIKKFEIELFKNKK